MKTIIDWIVIIGFAILLVVWVCFEVPASLLMKLLDKLEKRINSFI